MLTPGGQRPTLSDYQNTVGQLHRFAQDPRLTRATPRRGADGQPGANGGSFGAVYRLDDPDDNRSWALKCFLRDEPDRRHRYEQISACLSSVRAPWHAEVHYLEQGLYVGGNWWPVVLMEWIPGQRITGWIDRLIDENPADLATQFTRAARKFAAAVYQMHRCGISHGDLQSGNVLVLPNGAIRFVDYDAMTVPTYSCLPRREDGHPDFRLPRMDEWGVDDGTSTHIRGSAVHISTFISDSTTMSVNLPPQDGTAAMHRDRFPSQVIHGSLVMLGEAPELWTELHRPGADHLLLSRRDFRNPVASERWERLLKHPRRRVRDTANRLHGMLGSMADALPDLEPSSEVEAPQEFLRGLGWRPESAPRGSQRPFLDLDDLAADPRLRSAAPSPEPVAPQEIRPRFHPAPPAPEPSLIRPRTERTYEPTPATTGSYVHATSRPAAPVGRTTGSPRRVRIRILAVVLAIALACGGVGLAQPDFWPAVTRWVQQHLLDDVSGTSKRAVVRRDRPATRGTCHTTPTTLRARNLDDLRVGCHDSGAAMFT